jgi:hypothetical protein
VPQPTTLPRASEYSSDSAINVKISSGSEQSVSSDEAEFSATAVACNLTYEQIQVLSDHIFHLLASLAKMLI